MSRDIVPPKAPRLALMPPSMKMIGNVTIISLTAHAYELLIDLGGQVVVYEDFIELLISCCNENPSDESRAEALKDMPKFIRLLFYEQFPEAAEEMIAIFYQKITQ